MFIYCLLFVTSFANFCVFLVYLVNSQKALDDHKKAAKKQQKANKEVAGLDTGVETAEETCEETEAGETEFEEDIENQHLMQSEIISENIRGKFKSCCFGLLVCYC